MNCGRIGCPRGQPSALLGEKCCDRSWRGNRKPNWVIDRAFLCESNRYSSMIEPLSNIWIVKYIYECPHFSIDFISQMVQCPLLSLLVQKYSTICVWLCFSVKYLVSCGRHYQSFDFYLYSTITSNVC